MYTFISILNGQQENAAYYTGWLKLTIGMTILRLSLKILIYAAFTAEKLIAFVQKYFKIKNALLAIEPKDCVTERVGVHFRACDLEHPVQYMPGKSVSCKQ